MNGGGDDPAGAEQWVVRPVRGQHARKVYRCPGCDHEIPLGQPHVVVWQTSWFAGPDERRHWHTACWRNRPAVRARSKRPRPAR